MPEFKQPGSSNPEGSIPSEQDPNLPPLEEGYIVDSSTDERLQVGSKRATQALHDQLNPPLAGQTEHAILEQSNVNKGDGLLDQHSSVGAGNERVPFEETTAQGRRDYLNRALNTKPRQ